MRNSFFVWLLIFPVFLYSQNGMVGDGFGGRSWYSPTNYSVGSYFGFSICSESSNVLYGWGSNQNNFLGYGQAIIGSPTPILIPNMTDVKYVSGGYHVGAIKNDSTAWSWGFNIMTGGIYGPPIQILTDVRFLDASNTGVSFVKYDGTVWSIGYNGNGMFGDGTISDSPSSYTFPSQMLLVNNAVRVSNAPSSTIILLEDSTLMSVGRNYEGGLGLDSSIIQILSPQPIPGLSGVIDVKSTTDGTAALTADGDVFYWGTLGGTQGRIYTPIQLTELSNIVAISGCSDGHHFLAIDENKNCYAWGDNYLGQLGLPMGVDASLPVLVATNVVDILAAETFSYIVKSNGTFLASGTSLSNFSGSDSASIWLNLTDTLRRVFTEIDVASLGVVCTVEGINVSVNELANEPIRILVYPNPTSSHFTIESLSKPYNISIYNSLGQLLYSEKKVTELIKTVEINKYENGVYILRVETNQGVITKKIIKQ